jgi:Beta-propeller repeat
MTFRTKTRRRVFRPELSLGDSPMERGHTTTSMKTLIPSQFARFPLIVLIVGSLCIAGIAQDLPSPGQNVGLGRAQASYGKLPLNFEANWGQTDGHVKFLAHGSGYTVFLTAGQMVLRLKPSVAASSVATPVTGVALNQNLVNEGSARFPTFTPNEKVTPSLIQINLLGANRNPEIAGENPRPGKVNYFVGNDPKKWRTNIPVYKQVRYKNVYPGIDMLYYGNQASVEHDFIIAPGVDPKQIQLEIKGVDHLSIARSGDLILHKGSDELHLQSPVVYQEFHGMHVPVAGQYSVRDSAHVSFTIGPYDKTMPLVIDPVLVYGTFLGGSGIDQAFGIGIDGGGDAYVTGCTDSPDFPLASENGPPSPGGNAFIAKLDATGSNLIYADYIGGSDYTCASAITLDSSSDAFVTGNTYASDFPTVNPYQASINSNAAAAFVTEVSSDGSSLLYSTFLSGSSYTTGNSIGLDSLKDIYVAGWTTSTDFPTANAYQSTVSPNQSGSYGQYGFLTELAAGGTSLVYSTYYAGSTTFGQCGGTCFSMPSSVVISMAVDASGNAYITGVTNTLNFPTTQGSYQAANGAVYNAPVGFVGEFNSSGGLTYSTYYGATATNFWGLYLSSIAFDGNGSAYVVGTTYYAGNPIPTTNPNLCDPSQTGCTYGFISKFDPTGATVLYSTYLSPTIDADPLSVVIDANTDAYVYSQSAGGPAASLVNPIEDYSNGQDVLIQEIDPTGGTLLFSTFVGGDGDDYPPLGGMAVDSAGNIYITGYTDSPDFPVTSAGFQNTLLGSYNCFLAKISLDVAPSVALSPWSIQFPALPVGLASQPSTSLLRNMGSAPLVISSITTAGDFSETDTCGSGVPSAGTCTFTITFAPTQAGTGSGSVTIVDNAGGSPHVISLTGEGIAPVADLTPSTLSFPSQQLNQTSAAQTVTLTNNGNATLNISSIGVTGEYAQSNNCPASLAVGSSCQFQITFTPTSSGPQNGTLTLTDDAPDSPQSVTLMGSGADFSMPASGGSRTINPGGTANYQFSISTTGGTFSTPIGLSCSGLPAFSTCTINPQSITLGANAVSVMVAIKTAGNSAQLIYREGGHRSLYGLWTLASGFGLAGMFLFATRQAHTRKSSLLLLVLITGMLLSASCGTVHGTSPSEGGDTTPAGTYTVLVNGRSGSLLHCTSLSLTVR